jgi:putative phosphonate metabolism protein
MTSSESESAVTARYAIYWAPAAGSVLAVIGERWLGRDAVTERMLARQAVGGFDDGELAAITAAPRRYGLHATLKPPFRLARAVTEPTLEAQVAAFAKAQPPVSAPSLRLARIGRFLALVPGTPSEALARLAAACVETFDRFRAPAGVEELARRRGAGMTARQEENLRRWGYPYVMGEFRFHVTLTGPIDRATAARLKPHLEALFSPATTAPLEIGEIALFIQPAPAASFRLMRRFELSGSTI